jgi:hypothetical protein
MRQIKDLIKEYDLVDVFNMDETSLFYRIEPNCSLATHHLSRTKLHTEKLTAALTSNMDGSIKLPPFIISKFLCPRAFIWQNVIQPKNLDILWSANHRALMTISCLINFYWSLKEE